MAMRVGEMMVIVRAQDFASRTLRRVGGEFSHLSREQQLAFRKQQLAWQKYDAKASHFAANESLRQMGMVRDYRRATEELASLTSQRARLQDRMMRAQSRLSAAQPRGAGGQFLPGADFTRIQRAQRAVDAYSSRLQRLAPIEAAVTDTQNRLNRALANYPTWVRRGMDSTHAYANGLSRASRELEMAARNLSTAQHAQMAFNQAMARMPLNRIAEAGHALGGIGRTMQLFGAVSTVALGAAANTAADFNTEISLAATQARDLTAPVSQVATRIDQLTNGFKDNKGEAKGVLDLMNQFPATQNEMAASAYDIFSSMNLMDEGITNVREGLDLLAMANKIAVAGGEDLETATNAMITVFNNFDPQLENTTETLDTMFDIIRFGRMRLGDFNTMMNKVAPAAHGAGLSLRDVGGAMAFLTEVMPSQRMVATGISRLIEALNHPDIVKGLKILGVNVRKATGELKPLDVIMNELAQKFPRLAKGQQTAAEFFKMVSQQGRGGGLGVMFTAEGRKALTQIITHMDEFNARQKQIDDNTGEFGKTHAAQMQALGVQWNIFMNRVRAVAVAIGTDAIPAFQELGTHLQRLLDWWNGIDAETRKSIVRFAVFASVATLLGGAILAVIGAFASMAAMFGRFLIPLKSVHGLMMGLTKTMGILGGIGSIVLTIKVLKSGDATAWDLVAGALAGAAMGARFGPLGALAGGITVPIILQLIDDLSPKNLGPPSAMRTAWADYLKKGLQPGEQVKMTFDEFKREWNRKFHPRNFKLPKGAGAGEDNRAALNRADLARRTKAAANSTNALSEAQKTYNKQIDTWLARSKKHATAMKDYRNELKRHKQDVKEYNDRLRDETIRAHEDVVDSMRKMYMELHEINEKAMGELFQGPLLGGEAFSLAKEWGITPLISEMTRDITQATARFRKIQQGFAQLAKKGMPIEMMQEIQQMDPEQQLGFIQGILKGTPKQQAALIKAFKERNKAVESQTKMDFVDEIERFRKAGVSMGEAIKGGFQDANVAAWFDGWVQRTFPGVISGAVTQAVNDWKKTNQFPTAPKAPKGAGPRPTAPSTLEGRGNPAVWGTAGYNNDYSTTNIYINVDSSDTPRDQRETERRIGFIVRNAVGGPAATAGNRGRVIGRPKTLDRTRGKK